MLSCRNMIPLDDKLCEDCLHYMLATTEEDSSEDDSPSDSEENQRREQQKKAEQQKKTDREMALKLRDEDNKRRQLESQEKAKFGCFICNFIDAEIMLEYDESQVCQYCKIKLCVECGNKQFMQVRNGNRCPACRQVFGDIWLGEQIPAERTGRNYDPILWDIQDAFARLELKV